MAMIAPHNGGPAFPMAVEGADQTPYACGMSLRDYFAAQALALNGERFYANSEGSSTTPAQIAEQAYAIADAMLAEREK